MHFFFKQVTIFCKTKRVYKRNIVTGTPKKHKPISLTSYNDPIMSTTESLYLLLGPPYTENETKIYTIYF
uniref:Putative ovule protein n=1 Tax=Solanum chacoense TaxID=4108 RepID=A0A0V0HME3_SOLCH